MNSRQYKNLILAVHERMKFVDIDEEFLYSLDDLRKVNNQYVNECEARSLYPRHDMSKARLYGEELKEISKTIGIKVQFYQITSKVKFKRFTKYVLNGMDITQVIQP